MPSPRLLAMSPLTLRSAPTTTLLFASVLWLAACPDPTSMGPTDQLPDGMAGGGPPGGPGMVDGKGGPPPGGPGAGGRPDGSMFAVTAGEGVQLSGTFVYAGEATGSRRIDFLTMAEGGPPVLAHAITLDTPGEWKVEAPKDFGDVYIVAFIDKTGDGPSSDDPRGRLENAVKVGAEPISDLAITLTDDADLGVLTPGGNAPPPGSADPAGAGAVPGSTGALPPQGGVPGTLPDGGGGGALPEGDGAPVPLPSGTAPLPAGK